ncbi:SVEP1 [Branchiostoma lanceolatum]|uniref:SVEP1 protein n=1 Tax=Branchiostoma lanceolatum TaxID=7740 RepID=A0A8J9YU77_BRALA|nr:SVEP1 [Branchiostoma lanceolatum]
MATSNKPFALKTVYSVIICLGHIVLLTGVYVGAENMASPCNDIRVETSRESVVVTWPLPVFNVTSELVTGRCDRDPGDRFFWGTVWVRCWAEDRNGNTTECLFTVTVRPSKCPMWNPPKNGALACDRFLFGQFCIVFCNQEFEFDSQPAQLYVCGASGLWTTTSTKSSVRWPDCLELRSYKMHHKGLRQQYFAGDFVEEEENATKSVQQNFVDVFEGTAFGEQGGCVGNGRCTPENVAVFWGDAVEGDVVIGS